MSSLVVPRPILYLNLAGTEFDKRLTVKKSKSSYPSHPSPIDSQYESDYHTPPPNYHFNWEGRAPRYSLRTSITSRSFSSSSSSQPTPSLSPGCPQPHPPTRSNLAPIGTRPALPSYARGFDRIGVPAPTTPGARHWAKFQTETVLGRDAPASGNARPPAPPESILGRCGVRHASRALGGFRVHEGEVNGIRREEEERFHLGKRIRNDGDDIFEPRINARRDFSPIEPPPRVRYRSPPPPPPPPPHSRVQLPLHEEPILFPGLYALERPYTRDLISDSDEFLSVTRLLSNNVPWRHNPWGYRAPAPTYRPAPAPAFTSKRHPSPLGGPNPFRRSGPQPQQRPGPRPPLVNPYVLKGIEHLVDGDDEDVILYLRKYTNTEAVSLEKFERYGREEEEGEGIRPRPRPREAVINRRAYDRFVRERRMVSPDLEEGRRRGIVNGEQSFANGKREGNGNDSFDDFPVCEMSVAMGLHGPAAGTSAVRALELD